MDWNSILNWKLLPGPHRFPGPEGGTCINEAAIVAAGFKYRAVQRADDCPPCFSRVIASYALQLNDSMGDVLRQELLMPYVVRLAGTADSREVEFARMKHIALETIRRILPIVLRAEKLDAHADRCAGAKDLKEAYAAANYAAYAAAYATIAAYAAAYAANAAYAVRREIFTTAVVILDEAICLGKQSDPIETGVIVARMEAAKQFVSIARADC